MGAQIEEAIRRQPEDVERRSIEHGVGKPELMCHAIDLPQAMPAIIGPSQVEVIEMSERDDGFGRAILVIGGRQADGLWLKAWNPE